MSLPDCPLSKVFPTRCPSQWVALHQLSQSEYHLIYTARSPSPKVAFNFIIHPSFINNSIMGPATPACVYSIQEGAWVKQQCACSLSCLALSAWVTTATAGSLHCCSWGKVECRWVVYLGSLHSLTCFGGKGGDVGCRSADMLQSPEVSCVTYPGALGKTVPHPFSVRQVDPCPNNNAKNSVSRIRPNSLQHLCPQPNKHSVRINS